MERMDEDRNTQSGANTINKLFSASKYCVHVARRISKKLEAKMLKGVKDIRRQR
jgi:hypothetical protein